MKTSLAIFTERSFLPDIEVHKFFFIFRTTFRAADIIDLDLEKMSNSEIFIDSICKIYYLRIESRIGFTYNLDSELPELSISSFLRLVVAEMRLYIIELKRLRQLLHTKIYIRRYNTGGAFGL